MPFKLPKNSEFRLFALLASIVLALYLLSVIWGIISIFSDLILILVLSWLLAFILDPIADRLMKKGLSRIVSALLIYSGLTILFIMLVLVVLPSVANQLTSLSNSLPAVFERAPFWTNRFEGLIAGTLSNSIAFAQTLATFLTGLLLVAIISFYFLLSRDEINRFIYNLVPTDYKPDYEFFQKVLNTTFASFLRVQVVTGIIVGVITTLVLAFLSVEFSLSAGLLAGILAMVPVVGPIISIIPPVLAGLTTSAQKGLLSGTVLFLLFQLIYNIIVPELMGSALNIHPIVVILSFIVGFKIAGLWGAIFAVPIAVSAGLIFKELLKYWQEEADKS